MVSQTLLPPYSTVGLGTLNVSLFIFFILRNIQDMSNQLGILPMAFSGFLLDLMEKCICMTEKILS